MFSENASIINSKIIFNDFNTKKKRLQKFIKMTENKIEMKNKIYLIGFGSVGKVILYLIIKTIKIDPKLITIIDSRDILKELKIFSKIGLNILNKTYITKFNYKKILKDVNKNDLIIDLAIDIDTNYMFIFCNEISASYINSSIVTDWTFGDKIDQYKYSMAYKNKYLDNLNNKIKDKNNNFLISMGCNPGNVSIWVKEGIKQIAKIKKIKYDKNSEINFAKLSEKSGIEVIHISERDTQISNIPKTENTYRNTWSTTSGAYYEEGLAPVEISLGTHEKKNKLNKKSISIKDNYLVWNKKAFYVYAQSWIPFYGRYIGNIVRHEEAFTIGRNLSLFNSNDKIKYKPSIYYIYHPCDETVSSICELKEKNDEPQTEFKLLANDIVDGRDLLGLTYYLKSGEVFWIGSLLSIHEVRDFFDKEWLDYVNATNLQVAAGCLGGIFHLIKLDKNNIKKGLIIPDDLPYEEILEYTLPFLGEFIFTDSDFKITLCNSNFYNCKLKESSDWQFNNFLIDNNNFL